MKLQYPFVQLPLCFDAAALEAEVLAIEPSAWRPHPQGYPGNDALTLVTTGGDPASDAVAGPMRPTVHLQRCPYLMQVLDSIGATWGRTRLMRLSGQAEVSPHIDVNYYWRERMRVHVPIVTQPTVRFICGDAEVNMRAGECWIFDTWRTHNVINDHALPRIHLVADTVGGRGFWQLITRARPHNATIPNWQPRRVPPDGATRPALDYESENVPVVMTPWELRTHVSFALGETVSHRGLPLIQQALLTFVREWHVLWSAFGERREGWPRYRALLDATRPGLIALGAQDMVLANSVGLLEALDAWIFSSALADRRTDADPEVREPPKVASPAPATRHAAADPVFDRPVFIVSPPRSGSTLLFETLAHAPGLYTIGEESHQLIEGLPELSPESRGYESNRLSADDLTPAVAEALRRRFFEALRDRDGRRPEAVRRLRMLEKTPKNALRVPFLARVFPEARFIYLYREPRQVLSSMMEAWNSGQFRTYPHLPGWIGSPWSLLLVPGWRRLIGRPLHEVVAVQWQTSTQILIDDLRQLPADRWSVARYDALVARPEAEVHRICESHGLDWDRGFAAALPLSSYTVSAPDEEKWRRHAAEIETIWPAIEDQAARAARVAAR